MTAIIAPDLGDTLAAGSEYPHRDATRVASHSTACALFRARCDWWLAAATTYTDELEAGMYDAAEDAMRALAAAAQWSPRRRAARA